MIEAQVQGSWISGVNESELGPLVVEATFQGDVLTVVLRFEDDGRRHAVSGLFVVRDGWLVSRIMFKGRPVGIDVQGALLVLRPPGEPEMVLRRVPPSP